MKNNMTSYTTPKILEYAAKAVFMTNHDYLQRSHMKLEGNLLTVVFNSGRQCVGRVRVNIGAFETYPAFVKKLLAKVNAITGKEHTEENLSIY